LVDGLPADSVILDGEVVFIGRNGKPDFRGFARRTKEDQPAALLRV
jgi:hypothetical protein